MCVCGGVAAWWDTGTHGWLWLWWWWWLVVAPLAQPARRFTHRVHRRVYTTALQSSGWQQGSGAKAPTRTPALDPTPLDEASGCPGGSNHHKSKVRTNYVDTMPICARIKGRKPPRPACLSAPHTCPPRAVTTHTVRCDRAGDCPGRSACSDLAVRVSAHPCMVYASCGGRGKLLFHAQRRDVGW